MKRYLFPVSLLALLAGCASDPHEKANDAHDAELKAQRKQEERAAESRTNLHESSAEAHRMVTVNDANGQHPATQQRVEADAKLLEAREAARAKAAERLDKADAKTAEIKAKLDRAGGKAPTSARDAIGAVSTQRVLVQTEIQKLNDPNTHLEQMKDSVDNQLDTLEGYVKKAEKEAEKIK